jgi:hypothetical protein
MHVFLSILNNNEKKRERKKLYHNVCAPRIIYTHTHIHIFYLFAYMLTRAHVSGCLYVCYVFSIFLLIIHYEMYYIRKYIERRNYIIRIHIIIFNFSIFYNEILFLFLVQN